MPNPKKLLFITPSDKIGGGNRVMFELAARLSWRYGVVCAYPKSPSRPKYRLPSGPKPLPLGLPARSKWMTLPNLLLLLAWLRRRGGDFSAIISTGQIIGILLPYIKHPRLYNFVQTDEFLIFRQGHLRTRPGLYRLYSQMMRPSLSTPGIRYLLNSDFTYRRFCQAVPGYCGGKTIIHPGVDLSVFHPDIHSRDPRDLCIAAIGRSHFLKGFHILLEARRRLESIQPFRARWQIINYGDLSGFKLPPDFEVISPEDDVQLADIMGRSHLFLSTSLWEGFGLPALEAMACGCAVITSDNGGCREYAVPEHNCLVYPPQDPDQLAKQILRLVGQHRLRENLAKNGLATAKRFSWESSADKLAKVLEEEVEKG